MGLNALHFKCRIACPVCGAGGFSNFYSCAFNHDPVRSNLESQYRAQGSVAWDMLEGTTYDLADCKDCGLIFQVNVPNETSLERLYTEMIDPGFLQGLETTELTVANFQRIAGELALIFDMVGKPASKITLLDYGFGYARWARVAKAMGATVFGTEIGAGKRAMAEHLGMIYLTADEVTQNRYDIVHTEQVFEHLVEPGAQFAALASVCDGVMKVAVPPNHDVRRLVERRDGIPSISPFDQQLRGEAGAKSASEAFSAVQPLEHLNAFSDRTMGYLARKHRLRIRARTRLRTVAVDTTSVATTARSALEVAKMIVKPYVSSNGYYLFDARN